MRPITDIDELKNIELEIMKKVHSICVKNDITYFLSHGTLIGAIRHQGFIPWDDDIDIYMPREDYESFCSVFGSEADGMSLALANHRTKPYYGRAMSKVIDTRTVLTEPEFKGDDPIGVFIDIWPLDGLPQSESLRAKHLKKCRRYKNLLYSNITKKQKNIKSSIKHIIASCLSRKKIVSMLDDNNRRYPYSDSELVTCHVDPYGALLERKWFDKAVLAKFENAEFFVPGGYDMILTHLYGDYMELPPEDQRVPHHVINTYWKE